MKTERQLKGNKCMHTIFCALGRVEDKVKVVKLESLDKLMEPTQTQRTRVYLKLKLPIYDNT